MPANATDHCHAGAGCTPMIRSAAALNGGISASSSRLQSPIASSHAAYQRTGRALRAMRDPSANAPAASPPKNAVTTASTAADSWPSQSPHCCDQTIW